MSGSTDAALWAHVADERRDILDLLGGLSAEEWLMPSLCEGWRVRDVVAHLLVDEPVRELGAVQVLGRMAWWRFDVDRANAWWVRRNADVPVSTLTARMADSLVPGPVSRILGPANQLRAAVIHHQDMRAPLARESTIPAGRLRATLDAVLTRSGSAGIDARRRVREIRLQASDLDWSAGAGPEVSGPALSLLMVLAGRSVALAELHGEGVDALTATMPGRRAHAGQLGPSQEGH